MHESEVTVSDCEGLQRGQVQGSCDVVVFFFVDCVEEANFPHDVLGAYKKADDVRKRGSGTIGGWPTVIELDVKRLHSRRLEGVAYVLELDVAKNWRD